MPVRHLSAGLLIAVVAAGAGVETQPVDEGGSQAARPRDTASALLCAAIMTVDAATRTVTTNPASAPTTRTAFPPAPPGVEIRRDVSYLPPERSEKLDLYLPADRETTVRSPAVVIIHGGGWVGGDKSAAREFNIGTTLAGAGYVCASVNYVLDESKRWPGNLLDCKNAVRFLRTHADRYRIDPARIGVIGGSAGGHLALMVAYTSDVPELEPSAPYPGVSSGVRAVVNMYGITNLLTRRKTEADGTPVGPPARSSALVKGASDENPGAWRLASPVYHVSAAVPPTLILHGTADTTVDRDQAVELADALRKHGVEHRLILIDGIGHTFDLQTWRRKPLPMDLRPVVIGFFDKHLR
jgi:acetyl esterase/lipase